MSLSCTLTIDYGCMNLAIFFIVALLVKAYTGRYRYFTASSSDTSNSDLKTYNLEIADEPLDRPSLNPYLIRHEIVERLKTTGSRNINSEARIIQTLQEVANEYGLIPYDGYTVPAIALSPVSESKGPKPNIEGEMIMTSAWVHFEGSQMPQFLFYWSPIDPHTIYMYHYNSMLNLDSSARRYGLIEIATADSLYKTAYSQRS